MPDYVTELASVHPALFHKDFLLTWDHTDDELRAVITVAECLKELHRQGKSCRVFDTGLAISIFRDNSTRTRFSFASAANALGLGLAEQQCSPYGLLELLLAQTRRHDAARRMTVRTEQHMSDLVCHDVAKHRR